MAGFTCNWLGSFSKRVHYKRRGMMPTRKTLLTSVTSDSRKGRRYVEICRAQYDKAGLDGEEAQVLNEHPGFSAYLAAGIRQFSSKGPVFPVYLETEVGGKSKDEFLVELRFVSDRARDIMSQPAWKPGKKEMVKFARVKVRDLGFTNQEKLPKTQEIWARIKELGHSLCKPGDGPAIRLALKDQPRGDYFWIAMEQISDSGGLPLVFGVYRHGGGGPWLITRWTEPGRGWNLDRGLVFRLRKPARNATA